MCESQQGSSSSSNNNNNGGRDSTGQDPLLAQHNATTVLPLTAQDSRTSITTVNLDGSSDNSPQRMGRDEHRIVIEPSSDPEDDEEHKEHIINTSTSTSTAQRGSTKQRKARARSRSSGGLFAFRFGSRNRALRRVSTLEEVDEDSLANDAENQGDDDDNSQQLRVRAAGAGMSVDGSPPMRSGLRRLSSSAPASPMASTKRRFARFSSVRFSRLWGRPRDSSSSTNSQGGASMDGSPGGDEGGTVSGRRARRAARLQRQQQRREQRRQSRINGRGGGDSGGGKGDDEGDKPKLSKEKIDRYFAAYYRIEDASHGRDKHGISFVKERGPTAELFFNMRNSKAYEYTFIAAMLLHIVSAFFESFERPGYWVMSLLPLLFYLFDIGTKMYYMTARDYVTKYWNRVQVVCFILFVIDFVLMLCGLLQPFRLLRPWIYLTKDKELRRFFQALVAIKGTLALLFAYLFLYVLFFAAIGVHLFDSIYRRTCEADTLDLQGGFDDILIAFVHMITLSTSENYPDIMMPVFYERWTGLLFFGFFILLALFYVMPMALALVNDAFWRAQGLQWKKDRKKERKTLIKAFNMLDVDCVGWLSREQWCEFMGVVRPRLPRSAHELTYQLACAGKPVLDWENFLEITHILRAKLKQRKNELRPVSERWKPLQVKVHELVRSTALNNFICTLVVIHWVTFCLKWEGRPAWVPLATVVIQTFNVVVFVTEIALKVFACGFNFERDAAVFKIPVHVLEYALVTASAIGVALYWSGQCGDGVCAILGSAGQVLRLTYRFKSNLAFMQIVDGILEISFKVISIIAFVTFSYAVIAHELYKDVPAFPPYYCATEFDANHCVLDGNGDVVSEFSNATSTIPGNFDTLACSSFVMFQVFTTSNWHELMAYTSSYRSQWDSAFFISL